MTNDIIIRHSGVDYDLAIANAVKFILEVGLGTSDQPAPYSEGQFDKFDWIAFGNALIGRVDNALDYWPSPVRETYLAELLFRIAFRTLLYSVYTEAVKLHGIAGKKELAKSIRDIAGACDKIAKAAKAITWATLWADEEDRPKVAEVLSFKNAMELSLIEKLIPPDLYQMLLANDLKAALAKRFPPIWAESFVSYASEMRSTAAQISAEDVIYKGKGKDRSARFFIAGLASLWMTITRQNPSSHINPGTGQATLFYQMFAAMWLDDIIGPLRQPPAYSKWLASLKF